MVESTLIGKAVTKCEGGVEHRGTVRGVAYNEDKGHYVLLVEKSSGELIELAPPSLFVLR